MRFGNEANAGRVRAVGVAARWMLFAAVGGFIAPNAQAGSILYVGDFDGGSKSIADGTGDADMVSFITSLGHTVTTMDAADPLLTLSTIDTFDVFWNSRTSTASQLNNNSGLESSGGAGDGAFQLVTQTTATIVNNDEGATNLFGFHDSLGSGVFNGGENILSSHNSITRSDPLHRLFDGISADPNDPFMPLNSNGQMAYHGSDSQAQVFFGVPAFVDDAEQLGFLNGDLAGVVLLEAGGIMFANTEGPGVVAPADRIGLPFGFGTGSDLSADGMTLIENVLLGAVCPPGDFNGDCVVNGIDANILSVNWLATGATRSQGDANGDNIVNALDANIVSENWLESGLASAVPEPSAMGLAGIAGLLVMGGRRRRG